MAIPEGVQLERDHALIEVQDHTQEYGEDITVHVRGESYVERDRYGTVIRRRTTSTEQLSIKTYPFVFSPSQQDMEKAGIFERVDAILYTSMKDWTDNNLDISDVIPDKTTVIFQGKTFLVKDKSENSQLADTFLYINLGVSSI